MTEESWLRKRLRDRRFWRNVAASIAGWLFVNAIFYIEVRHFGVDKQTASLSKTPIGAPMGLLIQLFVFGDRLKVVKASTDVRPKLNLLVRWVVSKIPFFFLNQGLFWLLVLETGIVPYWASPFMIPPAASLIHYITDLKWTFRDQTVEEPAMA